jgi:predicted DNA-binding transcriptional regulator AlpA
MDLMTMSELAAQLGVSRQQVWAWQHRRRRNGFPEPKGRQERAVGRQSQVWSLEDVREWQRDYTPLRGGRPKKVEETC